MKSVKAPSGKSGTIGRTNCNENHPIETFAEFDPFASDVQTEAEQMYDELRQSFETLQ